jgi:soluble lytic murein transglycosylase-like protein
MKISTVLAAAFAAGLTTFAANAHERGFQQVSIGPAEPEIYTFRATAIERNIIESRTKDDLIGTAETKGGAPIDRGLTVEEVFHVQVATRPQERYRGIVERYASLNGVSVELAHAVITVESNYRVYSLGKSGEVGLMQIKPATAKMMGYDGSTTGLFDPETNIKYGMKYLGKAQKLGNGTTCGTILKYNAGHAAKRMNPTSRDYCDKVKRHLAEARTVALYLRADRMLDSGA